MTHLTQPFAREDEPCECPNCQWTGAGRDLKPIEDIHMRLEAGKEVPAGECPECGFLAYLIPDEDEENEAILREEDERLDGLEEAYLNGDISRSQWANGGA